MEETVLTDPRNEVPPGGRHPVGTGTMERDEAAVADAPEVERTGDFLGFPPPPAFSLLPVPPFG